MGGGIKFGEYKLNPPLMVFKSCCRKRPLLSAVYHRGDMTACLNVQSGGGERGKFVCYQCL